MIPIDESVAVRRTPWVTGALAAICILVFLYEVALPERALDLFIGQWGANPHDILLALSGDPRIPRVELVTLFTSQFLHGGWLHLLGNIVFLWVFGRAVEDRVGPFIYLPLYLLGGAGAAIFQSWMSAQDANTILIGASGAIAAVLGAYLVFFPTAWVSVLVPVFFFFWTFDVPAVLLLAFWFVSQFMLGAGSVGVGAAPGDVAVWAHVAGFVLGMAAGVVLLATGVGKRTAPASSRADGPGAARLVSSVADLAALVLGARILLLFLEVRPGPGILGQVANVAYGVTNPAVRPFTEFIPSVVVIGRPIDVPALAVILLVYALAGLLVRAIRGSRSRGQYGREVGQEK